MKCFEPVTSHSKRVKNQLEKGKTYEESAVRCFESVTSHMKWVTKGKTYN